MSDTNPTHKKHRDRPLSPADVPVDDLPVVEISDQLYQLAELIAEARKLTYQPIGGGRIYGAQRPIDANETGVIGELALQKALGKLEQAIFIYGDPGYDVVDGNITIDVKATATHMQLPELLIPYDQELAADAYLLAHRVKPRKVRKVRLVGWAPRDLVEDREPQRHPGDTLNYVVPPHELYLP